jgi:C4-dicarboxylate-specific signal transduction histidine kinase
MNTADEYDEQTSAHPDAGLAFFGKMCASISHEIKNCLAVISEQNGLHQDLLMLQRQGQPLAPERAEKITQSIADQVARMDRIVKRLNRFAHSSDRACECIDLSDICAYTVELCSRFAVNRGITLASEGSAHLEVQGQPFALLQVLVGCLEAGFAQSSSGQTLRLVVSREESGPVIAIMPSLGHTPPAVKSIAASMGLAFSRTTHGEATRISFTRG